VKKIRKKKAVIHRKLPVDEGIHPYVDRVERLVKENYRRAAVLGVLILFAIVFVSVYIRSSRQKQVEALREVEQAVATETLETRLALLQDVVDKYGGTLPAVRAFYYLGDAYYESGQYESARESYENYLRKYPRAEFSPQAQEGLGYVAESEGKFDEAIGHYMKLVETYGDSYVAHHAWYNIGRCREELGDWSGAVDAYEKQISLYPMSAWSDRAEARLAEIRFKLPSTQPRDDAGEVRLPPEPAEAASTE
jgi:tetratricopeptide (TPR) repeat protein